MNRLFYGNFDFEYQLSGREGTLPATVRRRNDELQPVWSVFAEESDAILFPGECEPGFFESLQSAGLACTTVRDALEKIPNSVEVCPWGWSQSVLDWAKRRGLAAHSPPRDAVRLANSRRYSVQWEQEWSCGLAGAGPVGSLNELRDGIHRLSAKSDRWVVKADFGMSARERILGRGRELTDAHSHWVAKRLRQDGVVVLEPWVEIIREAGIQLTVPQHGAVVLEGITGLLTDEFGTFRGSRFDPAVESDDCWANAISVAMRAAERIQSLGYFGPLGIDATLYRDSSGSERLRPLQDINARFTMGRLSLGLRRLLRPGEAGVWLHERWPIDTPESPRLRFEETVRRHSVRLRFIRTSPFSLCGLPVSHGTFAVVGDRSELLPLVPNLGE